jgi:hypothetical protein
MADWLVEKGALGSAGRRCDWLVVKLRELAEVWDLNGTWEVVLRRETDTCSVWVGLGGAVALRFIEVKFI